MTQTKKTTYYPLLIIPILTLLFLNIHDTLAQCGSVGDPIVNITFGTSTNPDFGGGTTTYREVAEGEGWYKLVTNINLGLPSWQNLRDHTGNPEGLMLVFNADHDPGEFYRIRVSGLCENTRFRFSAWIANANQPSECDGNPIPPNVRFVIEDTEGNIVSPPYSTGNIQPSAVPRWLPFGFEFDTGDQTEFDLVLINDNPGGCGNDLAIDDIQFRPCGPEITLNTDLLLQQADTLFFCEENVTPITLNSEIVSEGGYSADPVFQWQTRRSGEFEWDDILGENSDELTFTPVHDQWYRLSAAASIDNLDNKLCRIVSDSIRIARIAPQEDAPGIDEAGSICEGSTLPLNPPEFTAADVGPLTYQWQYSDGDDPFTDLPGADASNYVFQSSIPGNYQLRRQAINGCGDRFTTHTYAVEVLEIVRTTLTLPQNVFCADGEPFLLAGGEIINGNEDMQGIYRGIGVVNGRFHPNIAGVGEHVITFSPPASIVCAESSQATITVLDTIHLDPMENMVMLSGQAITLHPQTNASQFQWSNQPGLDNYNIQYPTASPSQTTTYLLTASNAAGCMKTGTVTVTVLQNLAIPNSFTPNGDGANDTWEIVGLDEYPNVFIQVFNRWGALMFSSKGYPTPWNGQFNGAPLPAATYYYMISSDLLERPLSGSVTILR